jgi:hypothetical protein
MSCKAIDSAAPWKIQEILILTKIYKVWYMPSRWKVGEISIFAIISWISTFAKVLDQMLNTKLSNFTSKLCKLGNFSMNSHFATLSIFSRALYFYQNISACYLGSGYTLKHPTIITSAIFQKFLIFIMSSAYLNYGLFV